MEKKPNSETKKPENDLICPVCHEPQKERHLLQCNHELCFSCQIDWFGKQKKDTCPSCRKEVEPLIIRFSPLIVSKPEDVGLVTPIGVLPLTKEEREVQIEEGVGNVLREINFALLKESAKKARASALFKLEVRRQQGMSSDEEIFFYRTRYAARIKKEHPIDEDFIEAVAFLEIGSNPDKTFDPKHIPHPEMCVWKPDSYQEKLPVKYKTKLAMDKATAHALNLWVFRNDIVGTLQTFSSKLRISSEYCVKAVLSIHNIELSSNLKASLDGFNTRRYEWLSKIFATIKYLAISSDGAFELKSLPEVVELSLKRRAELTALELAKLRHGIESRVSSSLSEHTRPVGLEEEEDREAAVRSPSPIEINEGGSASITDHVVRSTLEDGQDIIRSHGVEDSERQEEEVASEAGSDPVPTARSEAISRRRSRTNFTSRVDSVWDHRAIDGTHEFSRRFGVSSMDEVWRIFYDNIPLLMTSFIEEIFDGRGYAAAVTAHNKLKYYLIGGMFYNGITGNIGGDRTSITMPANHCAVVRFHNSYFKMIHFQRPERVQIEPLLRAPGSNVNILCHFAHNENYSLRQGMRSGVDRAIDFKFVTVIPDEIDTIVDEILDLGVNCIGFYGDRRIKDVLSLLRIPRREEDTLSFIRATIAAVSEYFTNKRRIMTAGTAV